MDSRIIPQLQSGESWNVTSSMVSKVVIVSLKDATGKNAVIRRDVSRFPCGRIVNVDAGPSLFAEINEFVVVE